ncbi:exosome complex exonuclease Rrp6p [[Candida] anglica]|uniref:Exosome complex exonuclease Rrp6p n=1 Tax=[Candida] anglica TaxID=148631 RepID=A0ABP0EAR2_9ASCO
MSSNVFEGVLPEVVQTIRAATSLAAQDVNFYRSLDADLAQRIDASGRGLLDLTNRLIESSTSTVDDVEPIVFGRDNVAWKPISDVLDSLFEKVDIAFDHANKKKQKDDQFTYLEDGSANDNGRAPGRVGKPQLEFKTKIDNSEAHPFKPKLTSKPHALKSLEESTALIEGDEESEEPPHYDHPYEHEIDNQPYPDSILVSEDPIPSKSWNDTSAIWVDTVSKLEEMIESLAGSNAIAVDLEHHDYRTYYGLVCLMQISNREQDWIVDTLALRDDLEPLNRIFTDPEIVKVFHGAFMDIIWLQRDLGLYIVSLFDTYHASKKLGFPKFSLAYLLETFANFKTSKKYQLADWRIRPLSSPMMSYARSDTHFLLNIFDQLRNKLIAKGDGRLQEVLFESRQVAKRRFEYTKFRPLNSSSSSGSRVSCPVMANNPKEPWGSLMAQYRVPYEKTPLVQALYEWRDVVAKETDESVRYIMPNQLLVSLSLLASPVDSQKVLGASNYISESVRVNSKELAQLIESTLKEMAENDWDLVDKLHNTVGNDSAFLNEDEQPDSNTIQQTTNAFEQLNSSASASFVSLLAERSNLLSDILEKEENQFSVEYDPSNKKSVKHTVDETIERRETVLKHLQSVNEVKIPQFKPIEVVKESEVKEAKEDEVEAQGKEEIQQPPTSIFGESNKEDLITIRKRSQQQKSQPKTANVDDKPAFDYANADKIMLETSKKFVSRKDRPKKRSFDPYGKESEGPQGAKKSKRMNSGKTSTFSNRRK